MTGLYSSLLSKIGLEDSRYLFLLPPQVKELLFQTILKRLPGHGSPPGKSPHDPYTMLEITTLWGDVAVKRRPEAFDDVDNTHIFGHEFQEDILVWHIATCIFLSACANQQRLTGQSDQDQYVEAIEVLLEYLMFLVALRPHMLSGPVLHSLFEVTRGALQEIQSGHSSSYKARKKKKLAEILFEMANNVDEDELYWDLDNANQRHISDAAQIGLLLLENETLSMQEKLEFIFDVPVDKLLYSSTRCNRESHVMQFSRGGEFTTIVWIMAEHAGQFRIGKLSEAAESELAKMKKDKDKKANDRKSPKEKAA
ncbi:hypothetical protein PR202_ga29991 [Eleusine coracana subsp. coracana]|uniref:Uncharacterized protein n=1 Tax=Eleusine coracana subsp. coracana TaxID=191504 RepID=A0AAV5DNS0_ELECO|nr:hypothetical protein PR202_ga29991 [Eleusine coracana subsp. coracana]